MDRSLKRLVRKLHAAELQHLRDVVAEQAARIEELEREAAWADGRAEMFQDLANELASQPGVRIGVTQSGQVGALQ